MATWPDFELRPLTRPYGLQAGMVFQAQALWRTKPLSGDMPGMGTGVPKGEPIPKKYEKPNNGLTFEVKTGKQEFNIELTP